MTNSTTTSLQPFSELEHFEHSRGASVLLLLIGWYQKAHSGRVAPCRFYPSCSQYAFEAVHRHGALRGSLLGLRRLSKCRPLGPHGIDLVPEVKKVRKTPS